MIERWQDWGEEIVNRHCLSVIDIVSSNTCTYMYV